jgi:hypothetical protein
MTSHKTQSNKDYVCMDKDAEPIDSDTSKSLSPSGQNYISKACSLWGIKHIFMTMSLCSETVK